MKITLTHEEVYEALFNALDVKTNYSHNIIKDNCYFIIKDADGKELEFEEIEFIGAEK